LRNATRARTPTVLQMEAVECGAAALGIVLGYHGRFVPLEELRAACGVSRDGSKASNVLKAARGYGLLAKGFKKEVRELEGLPLPAILFWNFNHFLVLEGFGDGVVHLNDPATGPRRVTPAELDEAFTGVVLVLEKGPEWKPGGAPSSLAGSLLPRLHGSRVALTYAVLAGLLLVIPGLVIPAFGRVFVDEVVVGGAASWVKPLLLAMGLTALLRGGLTALQKHVLGRIETKLALTTSSRFLWHVLRLPVEFFQQRMAADVGSRVGANDRIAQLLSGELATTVLSLLTVVFFGALLLGYDVLLATVGIGVALLNLVAMRLAARHRADESRRMQQSHGRWIATGMGGLQLIETIKATGGEDDFFARWSGYQARVAGAEQRLAASTELLGAVPSLLGSLNTAAILSVGALRVMDGHLSMGELVAFQSVMASFLAPVNDLVRLGAKVQEVSADMARLDDVLAYKAVPEPVRPASPGARLEGHVELRDVTFGYSRLDPPLVSGFSLVVKPGERVALVGGSGSGKSTLARLIAGLYRPWSGDVLLDGVPREELPKEALASVALVDQDIALFDGTVRDNVSLWDPTLPDATLVEAARDAGVHDEIAERGGYDQRVDEGGRNFSGGQRQRLEIARALATNPSVLLLDEATSALDPLKELEIGESLRRRGCTLILIAHRLSTVRDCDQIVVLEGGRAVQRGTHDEMIAVDGPYRRLIQAA